MLTHGLKTQFFVFLATPWVASLLFTGLIVGAYLEFSQPGLSLPGAVCTDLSLFDCFVELCTRNCRLVRAYFTAVWLGLLGHRALCFTNIWPGRDSWICPIHRRLLAFYYPV